MMSITQWFMKNFYLSSRRSKPRQVPQLPHDVLVQIAKHLQSDPKALQACTLTSRAWLVAAQPFLFLNIAVTSRTRLLELEKFVDASSVGSWIKRLELDRSVKESEVISTQFEYPFWFFQLAPKFAEKLVNLTTIHFFHITGTSLNPSEALFRQLAKFTAVDCLILEDCHIKDVVLCAFVAAFPGLKSLHLRSHHKQAGAESDIPYLHPPRLTSLAVDVSMSPFDMITPFLQWLSTTQSVDSLRSITVRNIAGTLIMDQNVCVAKHVGELLKKCSDLKHLGLTFVDKNEVTRGDSDSAFAAHFDLSHNPKLDSIEIKDPANGSAISSLLANCVDLTSVSILLDSPIEPTKFHQNHIEVVTVLRNSSFIREVRLVNVCKGREDVVARVYRPLLAKNIARMVRQDNVHSYIR